MVLVNIPGHLVPLRNGFSKCSAQGVPSALQSPVPLAQRPRLVHGSSEKGIPKDSAAILLCINPQGLFHFSVSSRLNETSKFHDENGIAACLEQLLKGSVC